MTALALFGICPNCSQPSDRDGLACSRCVTAGRDYIQRADGTRPADGELAAALAERPAPEEPAETALLTAAPDPGTPAPPEREWRRNQWCWAGDHRATCIPDPQLPGFWACRNHLEEPCG